MAMPFVITHFYAEMPQKWSLWLSGCNIALYIIIIQKR